MLKWEVPGLTCESRDLTSILPPPPQSLGSLRQSDVLKRPTSRSFQAHTLNGDCKATRGQSEPLLEIEFRRTGAPEGRKRNEQLLYAMLHRMSSLRHPTCLKPHSTTVLLRFVERYVGSEEGINSAFQQLRR